MHIYPDLCSTYYQNKIHQQTKVSFVSPRKKVSFRFFLAINSCNFSLEFQINFQPAPWQRQILGNYCSSYSKRSRRDICIYYVPRIVSLFILRYIFKIYLLRQTLSLEILKRDGFEQSYFEDCYCYEMCLCQCEFTIVQRPQCRF